MGSQCFFNVAFWQQIVAVILGIPAGLVVAYGGNWLWQSVFVKPQEVADKRTRVVKMLQAQHSAIDRNLWLLGRLEEEIAAHRVPTFNVDLSVLEATAAKKYDILDDWDLCQHIDLVRYELAHLSRKVDVLLSLVPNNSAHADILRAGFAGSVTNHILSIRTHCEKAANELAKQLCVPTSKTPMTDDNRRNRTV